MNLILNKINLNRLIIFFIIFYSLFFRDCLAHLLSQDETQFVQSYHKNLDFLKDDQHLTFDSYLKQITIKKYYEILNHKNQKKIDQDEISSTLFQELSVDDLFQEAHEKTFNETVQLFSIHDISKRLGFKPNEEINQKNEMINHLDLLLNENEVKDFRVFNDTTHSVLVQTEKLNFELAPHQEKTVSFLPKNFKMKVNSISNGESFFYGVRKNFNFLEHNNQFDYFALEVSQNLLEVPSLLPKKFKMTARASEFVKDSFVELNYNKELEQNLEAKTVCIPKIIHFIWVGSLIPKKYKENIVKFRKFYPDYTINLWTDASLEYLKNQSDPKINSFLQWASDYQVNLIHYYEIFRHKDLTSHYFIDPAFNEEELSKATKMKFYGQVSDALRVEILDRFGGIYQDIDHFPIQSFDSIRKKYYFVASSVNQVLQNFHGYSLQINNDNIMSVPNHPIWSIYKKRISKNFDVLAKDLYPNYKNHDYTDKLFFTTLFRTGPAVFHDSIKDFIESNQFDITRSIVLPHQYVSKKSSFLTYIRTSYDHSWLKNFKDFESLQLLETKNIDHKKIEIINSISNRIEYQLIHHPGFLNLRGFVNFTKLLNEQNDLDEVWNKIFENIQNHPMNLLKDVKEIIFPNSYFPAKVAKKLLLDENKTNDLIDFKNIKIIKVILSVYQFENDFISVIKNSSIVKSFEFDRSNYRVNDLLIFTNEVFQKKIVSYLKKNDDSFNSKKLNRKDVYLSFIIKIILSKSRSYDSSLLDVTMSNIEKKYLNLCDLAPVILNDLYEMKALDQVDSIYFKINPKDAYSILYTLFKLPRLTYVKFYDSLDISLSHYSNFFNQRKCNNFPNIHFE